MPTDLSLIKIINLINDNNINYVLILIFFRTIEEKTLYYSFKFFDWTNEEFQNYLNDIFFKLLFLHNYKEADEDYEKLKQLLCINLISLIKTKFKLDK